MIDDSAYDVDGALQYDGSVSIEDAGRGRYAALRLPLL
jgi:hypothetical protein